MHIKSVRIENFRNLKRVEINPHGKLNFFVGANGAGKTSLLEALVVLCRGRSFKTSRAEELSGPESETFRVFLQSLDQSGRAHKLGLERSGRRWKARLDGQDLSLLSALTRQLPLVLMEPNSHLLISGTPEHRRRYLDWGVFHVEPAFLDNWRRYARVLKQRNAALRERDAAVLDSLDEVMAPLGEQQDAYRQAYFDALVPTFEAQKLDGAAQLTDVQLHYHKGWKGESLHEALVKARQRDLEQGITHLGPHRADILLSRKQQAIKTLLSRGEQKSLAARLLLSQARLLAATGEPPLVLLDDLASEFDAEQMQLVLASATRCAGQVWVTGTAAIPVQGSHKTFHVEHGNVAEMV